MLAFTFVCGGGQGIGHRKRFPIEPEGSNQEDWQVLRDWRSATRAVSDSCVETAHSRREAQRMHRGRQAHPVKKNSLIPKIDAGAGRLLAGCTLAG